MKNVIYLVQGESKLIKKFEQLKERKDVDTLLLTYDKQFKNAIYLPNSTWAEGRNLLLKKALEMDKPYDYFIFLDDDVSFINGNFKLFEDLLAEYAPAVAVPVFFPKTAHTVLAIGTALKRKFYFPIFEYQTCRLADAQFIAFHKDVIEDNIATPLQTHFDQHNWCATSSTQQLLIHNLYQENFIQFNNIVVENLAHRSYTENSFEEVQRDWFKSQFKKPIQDPRPHAVNFLSFQGLRYSFRNLSRLNFLWALRYFAKTFTETILYNKKSQHHISSHRVDEKLIENSVLRNQFESTDL